MDDLMRYLEREVKEQVNSIRNLRYLESINLIARKLRDAYVSCKTDMPLIPMEELLSNLQLQVNKTETYKNDETIYIPSTAKNVTLTVLNNEKIIDESMTWQYGKYERKATSLKLNIQELEEAKTTLKLVYQGIQLPVHLKLKQQLPNQFHASQFTFDGATLTQKNNFIFNVNRLAKYPEYTFLVRQIIQNKIKIKHNIGSGTGGMFVYGSETIELDLSVKQPKLDDAYFEELFHAYQYLYYGKNFYLKVNKTTFVDAEARIYRAMVFALHQEKRALQYSATNNELQSQKMTIPTIINSRLLFEEHIDILQKTDGYSPYHDKIRQKFASIQTNVHSYDGYSYLRLLHPIQLKQLLFELHPRLMAWENLFIESVK